MYAVKLDNFLKNTTIWKEEKFKEKKKEALHMPILWKEFKIKFKIVWEKISDVTTYWNKLKLFLKKEKKPKTKNKFLEDRPLKEFPTIEFSECKEKSWFILLYNF